MISAQLTWSDLPAQLPSALPITQHADGVSQLALPGIQAQWSAQHQTNVAARGHLLVFAWGRPEFAQAGDTAQRWLDVWQNAKHGDDVLAATTGAWAVAVINLQTRSVSLAVDRFARHTACWRADAQGFAFANRADLVPGTSHSLCTQSILDYFHFHMIPAPHTIFTDVSRVANAQVVVASATEAAASHAYWTPQFVERGMHDFPREKETFLRLIREAVEKEVAAVEHTGGKVGAFLSGGTDSSTVSGMLCRIMGKPMPTFSIGFDSQGYDEMDYARIASRHFGTEQHEYYITPDDLVNSLGKVAASYDQPFGNSSVLPAYYCALMAREQGVTHMLAGDGGDELFGGNSRYAWQQFLQLYQHVPGPLRAVLEPLSETTPARKIPGIKQAFGYVRHSRLPMPDRAEKLNRLQVVGLENVFAPELLKSMHAEHPLQLQREVYRSACSNPDAHIINRMLAFDWRFTLADNDLRKVNGAIDLAGLSVGYPLLADSLLDYSLRVPPNWKVRRYKLRWFFKEALRGFLPDEIITKKKHGFGLPFGPWMMQHAPLKALATDSLNGLVARGIMHPDMPRKLMQELMPQHAGYYGELVWVAMMLEQWLNSHPTTRSASVAA